MQFEIFKNHAHWYWWLRDGAPGSLILAKCSSKLASKRDCEQAIQKVKRITGETPIVVLHEGAPK